MLPAFARMSPSTSRKVVCVAGGTRVDGQYFSGGGRVLRCVRGLWKAGLGVVCEVDGAIEPLVGRFRECPADHAIEASCDRPMQVELRGAATEVGGDLGGVVVTSKRRAPVQQLEEQASEGVDV